MKVRTASGCCSNTILKRVKNQTETHYMKCFHCNGCGLMVFFQNDHCGQCGRSLGFLPETLNLAAVELNSQNLWVPFAADANDRAYRSCANEQPDQICNWMVPADDPNPFCVACRLNDTIPNLTVRGNLERWRKLELAKRRCLYTLLQLQLPTEGIPGEGRPSLRFRFLGDDPNGSPITTGHENGIITLNIAEADADERESRRLKLHEPYRTLIGHFRHETGHYYWDRLVANTPHLQPFRELFGDETVNYGAAMQAYYQQGPPTDWAARHITAYASAHPWEDWAETWAHYLHIMDTLETAASFGVSVNADKGAGQISAPKFRTQVNFDELLAAWFPLCCALNSINRGMGLPDLYPFVIPPAVVEKIRFIHHLINPALSK